MKLLICPANDSLWLKASIPIRHHHSDLELRNRSNDALPVFLTLVRISHILVSSIISPFLGLMELMMLATARSIRTSKSWYRCSIIPAPTKQSGTSRSASLQEQLIHSAGTSNYALDLSLCSKRGRRAGKFRYHRPNSSLRSCSSSR